MRKNIDLDTDGRCSILHWATYKDVAFTRNPRVYQDNATGISETSKKNTESGRKDGRHRASRTGVSTAAGLSAVLELVAVLQRGGPGRRRARGREGGKEEDAGEQEDWTRANPSQ